MSKPQVNLNIDGLMLIGLGVGVPVLAFLGYKLYGAKETINSAVEKVNPANPNNFINQAVESAGQAITGDDNFTLGGWAFDWTHNDDGTQRALAGMTIPGTLPLMNFGLMAIADGATKLEPYVNPANPNNLVNKAVTKVVGEENVATAADKVFGLMDLLNPFNESDAYAKIIWGID